MQIYEKFVRALETLADVSDALKMPTELFQEEDIKAITYLCESWGNQWPTDFGHRNITPKGHILSLYKSHPYKNTSKIRIKNLFKIECF